MRNLPSRSTVAVEEGPVARPQPGRTGRDQSEIPANLARGILSGGRSLPTTGRPVPPRSMCTVFPAGKFAAIMHDDVTSAAPSSTVRHDATANPPTAGNHALEHKPSVRPGGHIVMQ